uniref:protein-tyrosine-phosphatase n=1 Tax=Strigamia maritima TaxID=126957 RepID=T1JIN9_STRMM
MDRIASHRIASRVCEQCFSHVVREREQQWHWLWQSKQPKQQQQQWIMRLRFRPDKSFFDAHIDQDDRSGRDKLELVGFAFVVVAGKDEGGLKRVVVIVQLHLTISSIDDECFLVLVLVQFEVREREREREKTFIGKKIVNCWWRKMGIILGEKLSQREDDRPTSSRQNNLPTGFPRILQHPQLKVVEKGRDAVLLCQVTGNPPPTITWLKDMVPVDMTNPRYSILDEGSLQITETQKDDQGKYECVAENSFGTVHSYMAALHFRRVPPHFSIRPESSYEVMPGSNLNITCVAVGSPMPFVKWRNGLHDLTPEDQTPIGKNVLHLQNIQESVNYTCIATSVLGNIDVHSEIIVKDDKMLSRHVCALCVYPVGHGANEALPRPPTNLRLSEVTATSVRLTWSYDIGAESINYYVVQYKPKLSNQEFSEISGITTMHYTVSDLSAYTEYEFYVIAVNSIGRGTPSTPAVVTTGETEPGSAPRNVFARPLSSSMIVIHWDEPEEPNGQVMGYKVYFTTNSNQPLTAWTVQTVDTNQLTTISELQSHTIYTIRVQAFTSIGPGPPSTPVQVKTQQGVPTQPMNLRSMTTSPTSVQLTWMRPAHSGETIISYELYWNDTFTKKSEHRSIPVSESYTLAGLHPNTLYHVWVAAKSKRGEGAATPPIPVKTEQFGELIGDRRLPRKRK